MYCANESQWNRYTSRFLKIFIKSQNAYRSPCKHNSLSIAESIHTHFISQPLKQNLRNHYQHWSPVFMTRSLRLAINTFLPMMVCISLNFLISGGRQLSTEWFSVRAFEVMTKIVARASNRIFVGPILCESNASVRGW